ncbi:MAG TPA: dual specificity protein phosphatase family protein [Gemmataceae bacterium]|nr:dual specificity protein phosphatase family protein [Gemmataceae bacterium]
MPRFIPWLLAAGIVGLIAVLPIVHYRAAYAEGKRLREVTPGLVYRSGQMTADGFADAVRRYGIRTVINLQDEYPDPDVQLAFLSRQTVKESDLCAGLGVRYVFLPPDLISRRRVPRERPEAIDRFLAIMDDPDAYPVLIHCKAGLHRTGCLVAVYRMEYEGWTPAEALHEMKAHGFGEWVCDSANDYITQYVLSYRRGVRGQRPVVSER